MRCLKYISVMLILAFLTTGLALPGSSPSAQSEGSGRQDQVFLPIVDKPKEYNWPMAGANPQRTSWIQEEVRGPLKPIWYRPVEPYIPDRVQIVTAYGNLYISTARGLYALDAATGAEKWVYPTELPLGHSPTVHQRVIYVGGFDHKIHAIHALTGKQLWTFEAGSGFDTNPLVVMGMVLAGNRDGYFYAIYADGIRSGELAWKYQTGGPIHFSAAYKDGIVYFASNNSYAYALDVETGQLVWRSAKLPGSGFHSYWPVIYRDWVIFPGSNNYRVGIEPGDPITFATRELQDIYPNHKEDPRGTLVGPAGNEPGDWAPGTPTINTSKPNVTSHGSTTPITEYFEDDGQVNLSRHDHKPWRRTYFVLDRATGKEFTFDSDKDGNPEYAPILWFGTDGAGNRFPPVVGQDGVIYQPSNFRSDSTIAGGNIVGWKIGTPFISLVSTGWIAVDEQLALSAGGSLIYTNKICDRVGGSIDYTIPEDDPNRSAPRSQASRDRGWSYFKYDLPEKAPGYNAMFYPKNPYDTQVLTVYGGRNGSYGCDGDENPPIPYQGRVYFQRGNAIIAFAQYTGEPVSLPLLKTVNVQNAGISVTEVQLRNRLSEEVAKIVDTGHLRPGYLSSGLLDTRSRLNCGADLADYFHSPAETHIVLLRALPFLPQDLRQRARSYLQSEFAQYPLGKYSHIGWQAGSAREVFTLPPEIQAQRSSFPPANQIYGFEGWKFNPLAFYAMWKYALEFGNASAIFETSKGKLEAPPTDSYLMENPHVLNAYIAGYWGYLELKKLATNVTDTQVQGQLNRLLLMRKEHFSSDLPGNFFTEKDKYYCRAYSAARNFMFLVPELGAYLRANARNDVQAAVDKVQSAQPYWFVSKFEVVYGEGVVNHLYDPAAVFQARTLILDQPRSELVKYLDIPAFQVGDLYYIQNLVAVLEAVSGN